MRVKVIGHLPEQDLTVDDMNPWINFFDVFKQRKIKVDRGDLSTSKFDLLIVNSHSPKALKRAKFLGLKKNRIIMIYWEPFVSYPKIHSSKIRDEYGYVYTPSKIWSAKLNGEYFYWPQADIKNNLQQFKYWSQRKNKSVMILSNKFSAVKGQNYTLRRKTDLIRDPYGSYLVDLFGEQWNLGFFYDYRHFLGQLYRTPPSKIDYKSWQCLGKKQPNYFGPTKDKHSTASEYRINLVIENSAEYVSEKLFEAHLAQSIVIYVGANLRSEGIDPGIAINCEPNVQSIQKVIENLVNQNNREQFKIMKNQHDIACKESLARNHSIVLADLAEKIIGRVN